MHYLLEKRSATGAWLDMTAYVLWRHEIKFTRVWTESLWRPSANQIPAKQMLFIYIHMNKFKRMLFSQKTISYFLNIDSGMDCGTFKN